jgi:hypothetical protein
MVEKIRRLRMPQRTARRNLVLGLVLLTASTLGVWFVIESNDKTEEFLVAAAPAASGSIVTEGSFRVAHMNLAGSRDVYLRPGQVPIGSYLLNTLDQGQLIPKGSVASSIVDARQPVIISSVMPVPPNLKIGDFVDVWVSDAIDNNKFAAPITIVLDAEVTGVIQDSGVIGGQQPRVQILVPVASVATILDAIASKDALSLVLKRNLGDD